MQPINYMIDVQNPLQAALQGYQGGAAIRNDMAAQAAAEQQRLAAEQQKQAAMQMQTDLQELAASPTTQGIAAMAIRYPQISDKLKQSYDMMQPEQQQARLSAAIPVYAAAVSGRADVAAQRLREQAAAARNSGQDQDAVNFERMADQFEKDPGSATALAGLTLSAAMGPDKFGATFGQLGVEQRANALQPGQVKKTEADARKASADARTAEVTANNAPTAAQLANEAEAEKILTERDNRKRAVLDAQIRSAGSENDRARLQLEREKVTAEQQQRQAELGKKQTEAQRAAQDSMDSISQAVSTVQAIEKHPGLSKGTGTGGDFMAWFNGSEAADFRAQVGTLKAQQFMAMASTLRGMGALSDAEGARLEKAVAALDTSQSEKQFRVSLNVIRSSLEKAQSKLTASGMLPTSGGAVVATHPQFGNVTDGQINQLLQQHPGATRAQVLQYLSSQAPGQPPAIPTAPRR